MEKENFWNNFLNVLSSKLNNISFNTWFKDAEIISLDNHNLVICAANKYKKLYPYESYSKSKAISIGKFSSFQLFNVNYLKLFSTFENFFK